MSSSGDSSGCPAASSGSRLPISTWHFVFGALVPIACLLVDIVLLDGLVWTKAPLWLGGLAVLGIAALLASRSILPQSRAGQVVCGMILGAAAAACVVSMGTASIAIYVLSQYGAHILHPVALNPAGLLNIAKFLFFALISIGFAAFGTAGLIPLGTAYVFVKRALLMWRLCAPRHLALIAAGAFAVLAIPALPQLAEIWWIKTQQNELASGDEERAFAALQRLNAYPLLLRRARPICDRIWRDPSGAKSPVYFALKLGPGALTNCLTNLNWQRSPLNSW